MTQRSKEHGQWERLLKKAQARFRAMLRAEGLDPDRMTEEEKMDYVDRAIHEYRQEKRSGQHS
jgi:hypothetical protein